MISCKILSLLFLVFAPLHGASRPEFPGPKSGVTRVKRIVRQGKQMKDSQPSAQSSFDHLQQILRVRISNRYNGLEKDNMFLEK